MGMYWVAAPTVRGRIEWSSVLSWSPGSCRVQLEVQRDLRSPGYRVWQAARRVPLILA